MIKIDLKVPLIEADDSTVVPGESNLLNSIVSMWLSRATEDSDPVKSTEWAISLRKTGFIEIDNSDYDKLYKRVKSAKEFANLVKYRILSKMSEDKELCQIQNEKKK